MLKKQPNHGFFFNNEGGGGRGLETRKKKTQPTMHSLFAKFLQPEQILTDEL